MTILRIELGAEITVVRPSGVVRAVVHDLDMAYIYFREAAAVAAQGRTAFWAEGRSWLRGWDDDAGAALLATQALAEPTADAHTRNAAVLFDLPIDGVSSGQRNHAKKAMAGSGYGSTMPEIAKALGVPLANVKRAFVQMVFP